MTNPTLTLGGGNWAVEEDFVLGYKINEESNKYIPRELSATRTSDGLAQDSTGVLRRYPWNLSQFSEQFENAHFAKQNSNIISNVGLSPINTLTADKLVPNTTLAQHRIFNQTTFSGPGTLSVYAKADGYNFLSMANSGGVSGGSIYFNLSNGTVSGTAPGFTPSIQNVGNGWYRCSLYSDTMGTGINLSYWIIARETASLSDFAGDDVKGILIWGAQINEGSILPYFRTTNRQDVLRVDYSTGQPALLLEPQRSNLISKSQEFGDASWTKSNVNVSGTPPWENALLSPDGTQNAEILIPNTTTNAHSFGKNSLPYTANTSFTFSVFLKENGFRYAAISLVLRIGTTFQENANGLIDLQNKTITINGTNTIFTDVKVNNSGDYLNGFTRYSVSAKTPVSGSDRLDIQIRCVDSLGNAIAGDDIGGIGVWGAQLEDKPYATTYIPNFLSTGSVIRNVDGFTFNNIYTNGFINASGGTWFIQLRNNVAYIRDNSNGFGIGDTSSLGTNSIFIRPDNTTPVRFAVLKRVSGGVTTLYNTSDDNVKIAVKWDGSNLDVFANGNKIILDSAKRSFSTTLMEFLTSAGIAVPTFIQKMELYNTPLSDTELTTLTTL